jgi:hypothetical protein
MNFKNFNEFQPSREASGKTMANIDADQLEEARPRHVQHLDGTHGFG